MSLFLAAGACGCGAKTGTVKGKATIDGKPATGAMVMLSAGENRMTLANIREDGTYEADSVPVGPVEITVRSRMGGMRMSRIRDMNMLKKAPPARIPARYTKFNTSGLTLNVKGGSNDFNIEMTSK